MNKTIEEVLLTVNICFITSIKDYTLSIPRLAVLPTAVDHNGFNTLHPASKQSLKHLIKSIQYPYPEAHLP